MIMLRTVFQATMLLALLAGGASVPAFGSQLTRSAAELRDLQKRIGALSEKLAREEDERDALTIALDEIDARLVKLDRSLDDSRRRYDQLQDARAGLDRDAKHLAAAQVDATARLGGLLRSGYLLGQQSGMRMLINQQDPHTAARRMEMFRYVIEARNAQLAEIASLNQRVVENQMQTAANSAALEQTLAALERDQTQLKEDKKARADQAALVRKAISEGKAQLESYRQRQDALEKLLAELRRPPKKRPAIQRQVAATGVQSDAGPPASSGDNVAATVNAARARVNNTAPAPSAPEPAADRDVKVLAGFANNRGTLPRPLDARIEAKFGDARPGGGLSWQGVLFGARDGQAVHAVYPGQVVFSDWFRGYGQLMVVDHGEGYMSLYGHNQGLSARVGDTVSAGQVIASANDAAEVPVPGLYFEIRHNGAPDDPLQWIR